MKFEGKRRSAFTIIEVIFVIVIIGILSTVAIPKLAATSADANGVKIANSLAVCVNYLGGNYIKSGFFSGSLSSPDTIPSIAICNDGLKDNDGNSCYTLSVQDAMGTLTINEASSAMAVCSASHRYSRENHLSNGGSPAVVNF